MPRQFAGDVLEAASKVSPPNTYLLASTVNKLKLHRAFGDDRPIRRLSHTTSELAGFACMYSSRDGD